MKGREALTVEWDYGANAAYNSDAYRAYLEETALAPGREIQVVGNVEAAFAQAAQTVEASYYVPMLAHAPMETPAALAWVKDDGSVEIWACTQDPQTARTVVAETLGVEPDQVTVHVTFLGGGFGRKSKPDFIVEAALVSKAVGAPVKLTWTREDEIRHGFYHAPSVQYMKATLDEKGTRPSPASPSRIHVGRLS